MRRGAGSAGVTGAEWVTVTGPDPVYALNGQGASTTDSNASLVPSGKGTLLGFYVDVLAGVAPSILVGIKTYNLPVPTGSETGSGRSYVMPFGGRPVPGLFRCSVNDPGTQVKVYFRRGS